MVRVAQHYVMWHDKFWG